VIVRYTELPETTGSAARPVLDVTVADVGSVLVPCLVDSGAVNTLLPNWIADVDGVDLSHVAPRRVGFGGETVSTRFATVALSVDVLAWEATVGFCDPWPFAWGVLGHDSFFRWFTVTFRAAGGEFRSIRSRAERSRTPVHDQPGAGSGLSRACWTRWISSWASGIVSEK
jgi:hypothetical protein